MTKLKQGSLFKKKTLLLTEGVLIVMLILSSSLMYILEKRQVDAIIQDEITSISKTLKHNVLDTSLAQGYLEMSINQKLNLTSKLIAEKLGTKQINEITNDDLLKLSSELNLEEITLYLLQDGNIVGQKSTEPKNINLPLEFTTKQGMNLLPILSSLAKGEPLKDVDSLYTKDNYLAIPVDVSEKKPSKQVFYKDTDVPYLIGAKVNTEEIIMLEQSIGSGSQITSILENDNLIREIAFLDLEFYKKESMMDNEDTSSEGVIKGEFTLSDSRDTQTLRMIAQKEQLISYVTSREDGDVYKTFIPADGKVLYIALDYSTLQHPLTTLKTIVVVIGLITILGVGVVLNIALNRNYRNLQILKTQIKAIASGDFTALNEEELKDDLKDVGETINSMVKVLNQNFLGLLHQLETLQGVASTSSKNIETVAVNLNKESKVASHTLSNLKQDIITSLGVLHQSLSEGVSPEEVDNIIIKVENLQRQVESIDVSHSINLQDLKVIHANVVECTKSLTNLVNNIYKYKL